MLTKPLAILTHLDDTDFLAQLEAVDRFTNNMTAYPGRTFGQLYHRFVRGNALAGGSMRMGDRTVDLAAISVPVLIFAGATDGIAPMASVRPLVDLLTGSEEVQLEVVPGGHLGMLTGRAARGTTWRALDEWVSRWSGREVVAPTPARKKPATKAAATKKKPAKKPAKKTAATKVSAKKASSDAIGTNPTRRYTSAGSRSLGQP